jgi:hypothetical protein
MIDLNGFTLEVLRDLARNDSASDELRDACLKRLLFLGADYGNKLLGELSVGTAIARHELSAGSAGLPQGQQTE